MTGRIIIVDEVKADAFQIMRDATRSERFTKSDLQYVYPSPDLDSTVEELLSNHCEMLISDFRLGENDAEIQYSGVDLVRALQSARNEIPCFLATTYPADAIREDIDPKVIFSKGELKAERAEGEIHFFDRAHAELISWRRSGESLHTRHKELISISSERNLMAAEVDELVMIDTSIERRLMSDPESHAHVKKLALSQFENIVDTAEDLLTKLKENISAIDDVFEE